MTCIETLKNNKNLMLIKYLIMMIALQVIYTMLSSMIPQMEQAKYIIIFDRIIISVLTVFAEEFLFRYLIIGKIGRYSKLSLITSSLLFALMHTDISNLVLYFIAGMIIGKLYEDTKDIKYPIILHLLNNFLVIIMTNF